MTNNGKRRPMYGATVTTRYVDAGTASDEGGGGDGRGAGNRSRGARSGSGGAGSGVGATL